MDASLFDYELPEDRIASQPAPTRDASRLLVVERATGRISHHVFRDLPELLPAGTALFRNNARVLRARLPGRRTGGGHVECLLLRPAETPCVWWCLLKPGKKAASPDGFGWAGFYHARVVGQNGGEYRVSFELPAGETVLSVSEKIGVLPLPPYIEKVRREHAAAASADALQNAAQTTVPDFAALDHERYQTVYADPLRPVAAAAPTAGLHFTEEILAALAARGFPIYDLTLRVSLGTFQPIKTATIEEHAIHRELYEIPPQTLAALAGGGAVGAASVWHRQSCLCASVAPQKRLAVGTTSLRAMEDFCRKLHAQETTASAAAAVASPAATASSSTATPVFLPSLGSQTYIGEAALFVYPPATFFGAELLLTNFHLPRSTLICLVSAFLTPGETRGISWLKEIYAEAISRRYRFYSYGDAMLIL
ncbi:MAG: S-adenosylmethionine:tRNA ribosyltransferase-isomerase [Puniceicoccales bacterium]|jgi:S-adenosylmethionine:tRNA ribosyltransferase-isomerase|nr:S-adenosylmethionine:tRNA ribosyltransferase-isomerase [Puniceicoccales bacterium]